VANGQSGGSNRTIAITTDITFWRPSISDHQHQRSGGTNFAGYQKTAPEVDGTANLSRFSCGRFGAFGVAAGSNDSTPVTALRSSQHTEGVIRTCPERSAGLR
jgi:hypothetical protein